MWFSLVWTLIANGTRHHSGQNVVEPSESATNFDHCDYANELLVRVRLYGQNLLETRLKHAETIMRKNVREKSNDEHLLSIRVQTTINHIRFLFYCNIKDNERNLSRFCRLRLESVHATLCK